MPVVECCSGQRSIRSRVESEARRRGVSLREITWLPASMSGAKIQTLKIVGSRAVWHLRLERQVIDRYPEHGSPEVDAAIRAAVWAVSWPAAVS